MAPYSRTPTGTYYYLFDDPSAGRWTQWDPMLFLLDPRGWNPYAFVGGDPMRSRGMMFFGQAAVTDIAEAVVVEEVAMEEVVAAVVMEVTRRQMEP